MWFAAWGWGLQFFFGWSFSWHEMRRAQQFFYIIFCALAPRGLGAEDWRREITPTPISAPPPPPAAATATATATAATASARCRYGYDHGYGYGSGAGSGDLRFMP